MKIMVAYDGTMQANGEPEPVRSQRLAQLKDEIDTAVRSGQPAPLLLMKGPDGRTGAALSDLPTVEGPVSVNPMGVYEGWMYRVFPPHSSQTKWNSFNAGEFLFAGSRWSLAPLLVIAGLLQFVAIRLAIKLERLGRES